MFMGRPTNHEHHDHPVEKAGTTAFNHLVAALQRAIDAGSLRADLDATRGAIFLWMGMHGITSLLISLSAFPWGDHDELIREMCQLQLRSLVAS
jgi:hypothetical protein